MVVGAWTPRFLLFPPWDLVYWFAANAILSNALHSISGGIFVALLVRLCLIGRSDGKTTANRSLWRSVPPVALFMFVHGVIILPASVGAYLSINDRLYSGVYDWPDWFLILALLAFDSWLLARICFVYPYSALNKGWNVRRSWTESRRGLSLLWVGTATFSLLPAAAFFLTSEAHYRYQILAELMPFWVWGIGLWDGAEFVVGRALFLIFVTLAFSRFVQMDPPGFAPSSEELAQTFE